METVRSKFKCTSKTEFEYGGFEVKFVPVYGGADATDENKRFWDATPNGELRLSGIKKPVADLYQVGREYYLDTTPAAAS